MGGQHIDLDVACADLDALTFANICTEVRRGRATRGRDF
jgi:hypothetical protein